MIQVLEDTILPIFCIIFIGYFLNVKGIIGPIFVKTANRIVYYVAIPAMLFSEISQTSFRENFHTGAVLCILGALVLQFILARGALWILDISKHRQGTFLQSCFHGNIGYIAYAMAYYALGERAFALTAILSAFLIIAQNLLAVWVYLSRKEGTGQEHPKQVLLKTVGQNPVILGVLAGIVYSVSGLPTLSTLQKALEILSGMALPTALLLIGASLAFDSLPKMLTEILTIGMLKLICLPLLGYWLMTAGHVPHSFHLPALILLAAPPATIAYIMAEEMGGDTELAAASISTLTLGAALTYTVLLSAFALSP